MNDWKERLKEEYAQLKERLEKLHRANIRQETERMRQICTCESIYRKIEDETFRLLHEQEEIMTHYLRVLELRAAISDIELPGFAAGSGADTE